MSGVGFVCIDCGARQAAAGKCAACGHDDVCDLADPKVLELMRDVDERMRRRRDNQFRFIGMAVGIGVIVACWFIPGYGTLRQAIALPIFADQWILMALIGIGVNKLLLAKFFKTRYPFFDPIKFTIST